MDEPGQEIEPVEIVGHYGMILVISLNRELDVLVDEEWLLKVLPEAPRRQVAEAEIVLVTDPNVQACYVAKNRGSEGVYLQMKTAAIG